MVELRHPRSNEYRWTQYYSKGILLLTSITILCMWPQAYGQILEDDLCSRYTTCKSCTNNTDGTSKNCSWSLEKQHCSRFWPSEIKLKIDDPQFCPNYTVVKHWISKGTLDYSIKISINETYNNFVQFLRESSVKCFVESNELVAVTNENSILCPKIEYDDIRTINTSLESIVKDVFDFHIIVNGNQIMFENDSDYFYTGYDHDCDNRKDDDCVTCLWNDGQYRYYNRWCSANNKCTGRWHKSIKELVHAKGVQVNHNVELMCPEIQIQLIGPSSGVLWGATTIEFNVKNHRILIENQTMTVTVAGWGCRHLQTKDDQGTITCTVDASNPNITGQDHKGPVRVTYTSWQNDTYVVTSKQSFRFFDPELKNVSTNCVPVEGGSNITITGRHMDAGNLVQVTVAEKKCEKLWRDQNQIVCTTSPSDAPTVGQVKVEFDQSPIKYSKSEVSVYSHSAELDADQLFGSIATGGITVPVRGRHFMCAKRAKLNVDYHKTDVDNGCRMKNDTFMMCPSPFITAPLGSNITVQVLVEFPDGRGFVPVTTPNSSRKLVVYPDPVFLDFEIQNGSVVINGRNLNQGYQTEDLAVCFTNSTDQCNVTDATLHRVLCVPTSPSLVVADQFELVVKVGTVFKSYVYRKNYDEPKSSPSPSTTGFPWTLVIISVGLSLSIVAILVLYIRGKHEYVVNTSNDSSHSQMDIHFNPYKSES